MCRFAVPEQYNIITINFFLKESTVEDSSNLDVFSTNGSNVQCYISYGKMYETVTIASNLGAIPFTRRTKINTQRKQCSMVTL